MKSCMSDFSVKQTSMKSRIGTKLIKNAVQLSTLKAELKAPTNIRKMVPGPKTVPTIIIIWKIKVFKYIFIQPSKASFSYYILCKGTVWNKDTKVLDSFQRKMNFSIFKYSELSNALDSLVWSKLFWDTFQIHLF